MRITALCGFLLIATGFQPVPAAASGGSFFGVLDMAELCAQDAKSQGRSVCLGYLGGVVDTFMADDPDAPAVCLPNKITLNQLGDAFMSYFDDNPDAFEEDAQDFVIEMLLEKYRC